MVMSWIKLVIQKVQYCISSKTMTFMTSYVAKLLSKYNFLIQQFILP